MVFLLKQKVEVSISIYNAQLVAIGLHHLPVINYSNFFSPIIEANNNSHCTYYRVSYGYPIRQLHVQKTFFIMNLPKKFTLFNLLDLSIMHFLIMFVVPEKHYILKQAPKA